MIINKTINKIAGFSAATKCCGFCMWLWTCLKTGSAEIETEPRTSFLDAEIERQGD